MAALDLTSLTVFPQLPAELRLKIWELASPDSRIISLVFRCKSSACNKLLLSEPVPALLHVNLESRAIAMESYSPLFSSGMKKSQQYLSFRPSFFNFDKDFLHIESDLFEFPVVAYYPRHQALLDSDISADILQLDFKLRNLFFTGETVFGNGTSVIRLQALENLALEIPPLHSAWHRNQDPQQLIAYDVKQNWDVFTEPKLRSQLLDLFLIFQPLYLRQYFPCKSRQELRTRLLST
jgi:hypothetical protein